MSDELQTISDIKLPAPTEGVIRTANIDDPVSPENSVQLTVNMNFDRIGAMQTRPGVTQYASALVDGINNYGTLNNFYPDGFFRVQQMGATTTFDTFAAFLAAAKIDDTHIIIFWTSTALAGKAQIFEVNTINGGLTPLSTAFEFQDADVLWKKCIKIDDTHVLLAWRDSLLPAGLAQVFTWNTTTFEVSSLPIGDPAYEFESSGSNYMSLAQIDDNHVICFYEGNDNADGIATVFEIDPVTFEVSEPGNPLTYTIGSGSGWNACVAVGDGVTFINTFNGKAQVFTVDPMTWDITVESMIETLVVAGGGGGGGSSTSNSGSGGGGAGELKYDATRAASVGTFPVVIGAGGVGGVGSGGSTGNPGTNGSNSSFLGITSLGGGGGGGSGNSSNYDGLAGGSGGGAGSNPSSVAGTSTASGGGFGHAGGTAASNSFGGGGGGGADAVGSNGTFVGGDGPHGGNGGIGKSYSISGSAVFYAGGGGGGGAAASGSGGNGGGGNGGNNSNAAVAGTANTGGGGGGANGGNNSGANGGSGVVVVSAPQDVVTATGGVKTTVGGRDIWTFNSSTDWIVTDVDDGVIFEPDGSSYNTIISLEDGEHFLLFWRNDVTGEGFSQVLTYDTGTGLLSMEGTPFQFADEATQNAAISLGDGEHFVNIWATSADEGYSQVFNVNPTTFEVTVNGFPSSVGPMTDLGLSVVAVDFSTYRFVAFWATADTDGIDTSSVFRVTGELVKARLYAQSGDSVYNLISGSWVNQRSGLSEDTKARFAQFLGYIWMVNGNAEAGGSAVQTSNGGAFGNDLVPEHFPMGDFIQAGFEGRVWTFNKALGVINYTDIVQFIPPSSYSLSYDPEINFISTVAPQTGQLFTAVVEVPRALLVFTEDTIYRIYGATSLDAYPAYNVGTYSQESIIQTKTGIFFHHSSGFYQFDYGSQPVEISRRIIDFVKAIPRAYYPEITGIYDGFDAIKWSIGQVVVEGVVFSNCVVRYTISTQVWTVYDYVGNEITAMIEFDDGTTLNQIMGTSAATGGKTGAMDVGTTDFGVGFYFEFIDRWRSFTEIYAKQKSISGFNVYSENAAGTNFLYQVQKSGPNAWQPIDTVSEANNSLFPNAQTDDFDVIRLRLAGNTKGVPIVVHGIEIMQLTIKGFNEN